MELSESVKNFFGEKASLSVMLTVCVIEVAWILGVDAFLAKNHKLGNFMWARREELLSLKKRVNEFFPVTEVDTSTGVEPLTNTLKINHFPADSTTIHNDQTDSIPSDDHLDTPLAPAKEPVSPAKEPVSPVAKPKSDSIKGSETVKNDNTPTQPVLDIPPVVQLDTLMPAGPVRRNIFNSEEGDSEFN